MKIAIYGYGNLGRGVDMAIHKADDIEAVGIFTRRCPKTVNTISGIPVYPANEIDSFKDKADVVIICGGSATDLPLLTPMLAEKFNVIDSFDTHAVAYEHYKKVDEAAKRGRHTALISCGWDPGMFSLSRLYSAAILPDGMDYTFWGMGVSQGHSDAVRRIKGVLDAKQYTVPIDGALESVKSGTCPHLSATERHRRVCYVVAEKGADKIHIEKEIKNMPNYFYGYDTEVNFISEDEMRMNHSGMPHGGTVIRTGKTGLHNENRHVIEYSLKLDSNPEFSANILVAFARAVYKLSRRSSFGCKTVFDVAPADLLPVSREEIIRKIL